MHRRLHAIWYGAHPLGHVLAPLGWLFCVAAAVRRLAYRTSLFPARHFDAPVIVVGNIAVGGTGKTPLVIWLARFLRANGYRPGIVCRGYGGKATQSPQQVRADSDPLVVGDEAILLAQRAGCPVAAGPKRAVAVESVTTYTDCDIVLSDDGLQHLALGRDIEILVIDGTRRHGNGRCLPAGPLREPVSRIREVDAIVTNGPAARGEFGMSLVPGVPRSVRDQTVSRPVEEFRSSPVHAVAGIGNPERFFNDLRRLGLRLVCHAFPDHHRYTRKDIDFGDSLPVLMTEKDAVKCRELAGPHHWYLPVQAEVHPLFGGRLLTLLRRNWHGQKAA